MQIECLGNRKLLESRKVTFLCSRTVSSGAVLRCYDWATKMAVSRSFITAARRLLLCIGSGTPVASLTRQRLAF